ncbi:hypothetical protein BV898_18639 [Hypsibius exemplaris]|uniref:Uncharacterized protein n=1 Tax=Hypsibius exemplaris TaxID=2072580 RepID=A0A9X6RNC4_HYPEX|nr:hypothetical protein BV898_18639 [Hypsibius exemplaris]
MFVRSISVLLCVLGLAVSSAFELGSVSGAVKDAVSGAYLASFIYRSITGPGVLSGLAKHAQTGRGEPGVLLHFRKGLRVHDGPVIGSVVSGTDGSWSIVLDTGSYTMQGSKDGFVTGYHNVISLGHNPVYNQDISLTPIPPPGETRIVLTWGLHPRDLDSHLTGPLPGSSERFRVYFNARGSKVTYPFSDLDVDDTSSYGPETTTITRQAAGVYRFAVHHFSGEGLMSNSGAKVTVTHAGSYREFHIPPRVPGVVWTVFELNGNSIVPINTITNNQIQ